MAREKLGAPKGTHDILPDEVGRWQYVEGEGRSLLATYGYQEIRTPIFELAEVFSRGIGEHTDVVGKEMYTFDDKKGLHLTLRPESTAGVVRALIQNKLYAALPQKLWYAGPMFRYERPQAGRQRQFHQLGVECLGTASMWADAEVILMAWALLERVGLTGLAVQLNSLGCPNCRPAFRERLKQYLDARAADLCETCQVRVERNPMRVLDCKVPACAPIIAAAPSIADDLCAACRAAESELTGLLTAGGVPFELNRRLMRGLDYYTRTVFEITSGQLGAQNTVCAGGRYDGLVEELGGPATPAVGWAIGLERLLMLMPNDRTHTKRPATWLLADADAAERALALAVELRGHGLAVEAPPPGTGKWLAKGLKAAEEAGARYALILGPNEVEQNSVAVKDLAARSQATVALADIAAWLLEKDGVRS